MSATGQPAERHHGAADQRDQRGFAVAAGGEQVRDARQAATAGGHEQPAEQPGLSRCGASIHPRNVRDGAAAVQVTERAPPAAARCGGATPPAISPCPAAPHPQPEGALCSGSLDVSSPTAAAVSNGSRRLSRPRVRGIPWRRVEEVARLYRAGWTVANIAERMGLRPGTVRIYATHARRAGGDVPNAPATGGWPRRVQFGEVCRLAREGLAHHEIGARLGANQSRISRIIRMMREAGEPLPPPRRGAKVAPATQPAPTDRPIGPPIPAGRQDGGLSGYGV